MKRIIASLVVFASMCVLGLVPGSPLKADDDRKGSIVGTWIGTGTVDTPPGTPPFVFTELAIVNDHGTVAGTNGISHSAQNPFVPPPLAVDLSDYFGSWVRIDDPNQFAVTLKRLLFASANTPAELYGPFFVGQHVGEATIQVVVTLHHGEDGDTLEGPFTFQLRNLNGDVVFAAMGTISFTRLKIEPLATP